MKSFFKELFEYNFLCNRILIEKLQSHEGQVSEKTMQLLSHTLNAHQIWNSRITNKPTLGVFDLHDLPNCLRLNQENTDLTYTILEDSDLMQNIFYNNSKGEAFCNPIRDILFHVINHSTYHRAQIASDMKQCNITPIISDYIFHKRKPLE